MPEDPVVLVEPKKKHPHIKYRFNLSSLCTYQVSSEFEIISDQPHKTNKDNRDI